MHKRLRWDFFVQQFPRDITEDHELAEDESATRSPLNYGEAIIVLPGTDANENHIGRFFQTLYDGLSKDQRARMPYENAESRFPLTFHPADDALNKNNDLMMATITPRAIPVNNFGSGNNTNTTYEFYNPSALAHQLAFGQLPIKLCYAVVKPREIITSGLEWIRIDQLQTDADTTYIDLSAWVPALFITQSYKRWWEEWKEHLFKVSAHMYRNMVDPEHEVPNDVVSPFPILQSFLLTLTLSVTYPLLFQQVDDPAPIVSRSGRPIDLLPSSPVSLIGHNAPSLAVLMHRNIRFKKTTKRSKTFPSVAAATLAQAFKVKCSNFLFIMPISSHIHIILSGCISYDWNVIGNFVLYQAFYSFKFQQFFSAFISNL